MTDSYSANVCVCLIKHRGSGFSSDRERIHHLSNLPLCSDVLNSAVLTEVVDTMPQCSPLRTAFSQHSGLCFF